jgi:opacity protein-like surface antigen
MLGANFAKRSKMMRKILITVSAAALTVLGASAASANPKNTFSDGGYNYVSSSATAGYDATSESYNSSNDAVSYQELSASAVGAALTVESIPIFSGNASVSDIHDNAGVTMSSANTGNGTVAQQAVSLAAVGSVSIQ